MKQKSHIAVSENLQELAEAIDEALMAIAGERVAFTMLVFTPERANYISTCSRDEARKALQDLLDHWNACMEDIPAHKIN